MGTSRQKRPLKTPDALAFLDGYAPSTKEPKTLSVDKEETESPKQTSLKSPPDPDGMNDSRAAAAERALLFFANDFGEKGDDPSLLEQNLGDLLADLAHMCDRKGMDLRLLFEKAGRYYAEETDREGLQFSPGVLPAT